MTPVQTLEARLTAPGPKRILALDGGGIRGVLTLGYLARIEAILRARSSTPETFCLADYFDLIGGTSTGSIIPCTTCAGGWPRKRWSNSKPYTPRPTGTPLKRGSSGARIEIPS